MNNESWLDLLLSELGWNPEDLARASGLDPATISNIRSGRRGVGVRVAGIIADATSRTTDEILRRAGVLKSGPDEEIDPVIEAGIFALKRLRGRRTRSAFFKHRWKYKRKKKRMRDVKRRLEQLGKVRLLYVVFCWWVILLAQSIEDMRPARVVVRFSLVQIGAFVFFATTHERFFIAFTLFNLLLISFAMAPSLFARVVVGLVNDDDPLFNLGRRVNHDPSRRR